MKKIFSFMLNITWVVMFIIGLQSLVWNGWHFNIISGEEWSALGQAWRDGKFVIDNGPKFLFVLILLSSPFLLLFSIWLINKINFSKFFENKPGVTIDLPKKKKTEEQILKELEENPTTTLDIRPNAIGQLPQEVGEVGQEKKQQLKLKQEEKAAEEQIEEKEKEKIEEQQKQSPELVNKAIFEELQEKGYTILKEVTLGDNIVDFLAIAKGRIILIGIDEEAGDWTANEEAADEAEYPEWFSLASKRESPVNMIMESYATLYPILKDALGGEDFPINVVLVISCANVVNIKEIKAVWADLGASVVRHKHSADSVPKSLEMFAGILPNEKNNPATDERIAKIKDALGQETG